MNGINQNISKYLSVFSNLGETVSLIDELKNISSGKYKYEIIECRKLFESGNKVAYKKRKTALPSLTFSGQFNGAHKTENLVHYSGFIIIDIDGLNKEVLENVKSNLFSDKYVAAIWVSPSGNGLKVLVGVSSAPDEHKQCFDVLENYLSTKYNVEVDKSGSDICRLCFVSHDENIFIKNEFSRFDFKEYEVTPKDIITKPRKSKSEISITDKGVYTPRAILYGTENRNKQRDRETIIRIIKYLTKNQKSITTNYSNWFRVACAVSNTFTIDLGQKYYLELCRLDGALHDEYKSQYLLDYCYRNRKIGVIDFSTIIYLAQQQGFVILKPGGKITKSESPN